MLDFQTVFYHLKLIFLGGFENDNISVLNHTRLQKVENRLNESSDLRGERGWSQGWSQALRPPVKSLSISLKN